MGLVYGQLINHYVPTNLLFVLYGTNNWKKTPVSAGGTFSITLDPATYQVKARHDNRWKLVKSPKILYVHYSPQPITVDGRANPGTGDEFIHIPEDDPDVEVLKPPDFEGFDLDQVVQFYQDKIKGEKDYAIAISIVQESVDGKVETTVIGGGTVGKIVGPEEDEPDPTPDEL